ncbi:TPA: ATP-binding protein, partial [Streptococcus pyogenes]
LKGNIELLEMTEVNEQQADFIESMKNSLTVFDKYFNTMISYTKLLNDENDYKARISLEDFLIDLSFELEELSTTYQVDYQLVKKTDLTTFYGNTLALSRALINIFVNACQYAKEGEKIVSLSIYDDEKYLYFEIWNNGHPFSEQAKKNAGKLFFTEDTGRSGKHYGIGLSFAQGVALKHQGNLILSNPQKGGAEVILKIKK